MSNPADDMRIRLSQQLQADQMFGIREVPLRAATGSALQEPGPAAGRGAIRPAAADAAEQLRVLDESQVRDCRKCSLCETRTHTVFGQGSAQARLMFVGEAPGFEEDRQGLAFVGRAGQLLTRMIEAMGLTREQVFICNVLKCRPPNNRTPAHDEIAACSPYLFEQVRILQPEIICALGAPAAQTLLGTGEAIGRLRGRFHDFRLPGAAAAVPLMPTYHPAYLLRAPGEKRKAWEDLQLIMERLGLPLPK